MLKPSFLYFFVLFFNVFIFSNPNKVFSATQFNVRDFNAKGDGKTDDILAFERCAQAAINAKDAEIVIPFGSYKISRPWVLFFTNETIYVTGAKSVNGLNPTIFINSVDDVIRIKGFLFDKSQGVFRIKNLNIVGSNPAYSLTHPHINLKKWHCGLAITDKREASVDNVHVKNVYGQGIYIADTKQNGIPNSARFDAISIVNCIVSDVWGYNPKDDDYGDGIYISNAARGLLQNNQVYNNTKQTKQIGRAGIVLEYMSENIHVLNNVVRGGYDRAIHIESTFGGHLIERNEFLGSDLAFVLVEPEISRNYKTTFIQENLLSNVNLIKGSSFNKTYARNSFGDRALLFILSGGSSGQNKIQVKHNKFIANGAFVYNSNSILNNRSGAADFYKNEYKIINMPKDALKIFNYSNAKFDSEILPKGLHIAQ